MVRGSPVQDISIQAPGSTCLSVCRSSRDGVKPRETRKQPQHACLQVHPPPLTGELAKPCQLETHICCQATLVTSAIFIIAAPPPPHPTPQWHLVPKIALRLLSGFRMADIFWYEHKKGASRAAGLPTESLGLKAMACARAWAASTGCEVTQTPVCTR